MKKLFFLSAAFLCLGLTSCSNDSDSDSQNFNVETQSGINKFYGNLQAEKTPCESKSGATKPLKAAGTKWDETDRIGIYSSDSTDTNVKAFDNSQWITQKGNGYFDPVEYGTVYYFTNKSDITFTSYYPYSASVSKANPVRTFTITDANQEDDYEGGKPNIDMLWAQSTVTPTAKPYVNFVFRHKMAMVQVKFTPGVGNPELDKDGTFTYDNANLTGTFNTLTGVATATGTGTMTLTRNYAKTIDFIVFPGDIQTGYLTFAVDGKEFYLPMSKLTQAEQPLAKFEAGKRYTLNVTLSQSEAHFGDPDDSNTWFTIEDWVNSTIDDVTATNEA